MPQCVMPHMHNACETDIESRYFVFVQFFAISWVSLSYKMANVLVGVLIQDALPSLQPEAGRDAKESSISWVANVCV